MILEAATNRLSTMKSEQHSGSDRTFNGRRAERGSPQGRDKTEERKEALVLLAIAVLFLANVLLYLCHHYGFLSQAENHSTQPVAARVIID